MRARRALRRGAVAVSVLGILGSACSGPAATLSKAPAGEVRSSSGLPSPLSEAGAQFSPPPAQTAGPVPNLPRSPAMPPDTVMLDTLARQGQADVLP